MCAAVNADSALQLLVCAEEVGQIGTWAWNLETDEIQWSDNLFRLYGLESEALVPTLAYLVERAHPADRARVGRAIDSARLGGELRPLEYRTVWPDGAVRHLRVSQAVVERDGGLRRILGSVQDISDRRCAERELDARIAASEALVDWKAFEQGATGVLRNLGEALAFGAGVMWIPDCDVLVARVVWHSGSIDFSEVESVIGELRLRRGQCLPGRVWERGEPLGAPGTDANPSYAAEVAAGLRGAVALPAKHAGEVLAVVEFYLCEPADAAVTDRLLRSLSSIGCELGRFLAGRRGELKPLPLTPRELEVLQLAAQGHSAREIAERLVLSPATVRTHFEHIYEKYGVSQRASAVAQALREGLIE